MRLWRYATVGAAWLTATALGGVAAWAGLQPVLDTAVPDRSAPLSAAEARGAPARPSTPVPATPTPSPSRPDRSPTLAPPTERTVHGWTVTTDPDGGRSWTRRFQVTGGSAVVRVVPGAVTLVSATPVAGYTVQTTQQGADRLVVQFVGTGRSQTVDAMWWQGGPYAQVTHVD